MDKSPIAYIWHISKTRMEIIVNHDLSVQVVYYSNNKTPVELDKETEMEWMGKFKIIKKFMSVYISTPRKSKKKC